MTVNRYLFQSPYSNSVQIGRPDPSVKKEESGQDTAAELPVSTNQTFQDAKNFQASQVSEVTPVVDSAHLLDVYA